LKTTGFGRTGKEMFGVNYERLVELKRKFDPENKFNKFVDLTGSE
jgi:FAD/FMN-containing dehydrogenase